MTPAPDLRTACLAALAAFQMLHKYGLDAEFWQSELDEFTCAVFES